MTCDTALLCAQVDGSVVPNADAHVVLAIGSESIIAPGGRATEERCQNVEGCFIVNYHLAGRPDAAGAMLSTLNSLYGGDDQYNSTKVPIWHKFILIKRKSNNNQLY